MNINKFNLIRKTYKQVMPDIILSTDYGIDFSIYKHRRAHE